MRPKPIAQRKTQMITVTITPAGRGRFTTTINGTSLVTVPTSNPMYGSCRALVALGYDDGPVQFLHAGSDKVAASIVSIHRGAKLRVEEASGGGLRTVAYRPFPELAGSETRETAE